MYYKWFPLFLCVISSIDTSSNFSLTEYFTELTVNFWYASRYWTHKWRILIKHLSIVIHLNDIQCISHPAHIIPWLEKEQANEVHIFGHRVNKDTEKTITNVQNTAEYRIFQSTGIYRQSLKSMINLRKSKDLFFLKYNV